MKTTVSNSDLNWLQMEVLSSAQRLDFEQARKMSALVYAMITEPERVNYIYNTLDDEIYTPSEFDQCEKMKIAFKRDEYCAGLLAQTPGQTFKSNIVELTHGGFSFELKLACRYHIWNAAHNYGAGIQSTSAETAREFEKYVFHFDYDRKRVVYMLASGALRDSLIGISKINNKIFKIPIVRGDRFWNSGIEKLNEIGFKWWLYFDNFGNKRT